MADSSELEVTVTAIKEDNLIMAINEDGPEAHYLEAVEREPRYEEVKVMGESPDLSEVDQQAAGDSSATEECSKIRTHDRVLFSTDEKETQAKHRSPSYYPRDLQVVCAQTHGKEEDSSSDVSTADSVSDADSVSTPRSSEKEQSADAWPDVGVEPCVPVVSQSPEVTPDDSNASVDSDELEMKQLDLEAMASFLACIYRRTSDPTALGAGGSGAAVDSEETGSKGHPDEASVPASSRRRVSSSGSALKQKDSPSKGRRVSFSFAAPEIKAIPSAFSAAAPIEPPPWLYNGPDETETDVFSQETGCAVM